MKKNDLSIIIGTAAYSFLFYEQYAGLNFLVFTMVLISAIVCIDRSALKNRMFLLFAFLSIFSACFIVLYGSSLAILGNCIALLLLSASRINPNTSVIFSLVFSLYSIAGSLVFMIAGLRKKQQNAEESPARKKIYLFLTYFIPFVLLVIFFLIYKNINPLFEEYTPAIDFKFISWGWVFFTFAGFLMVYGLVKHHTIVKAEAWENSLSLSVSLSDEQPKQWDERRAVVILFVFLNLMLLFINALDVNYLYLGAGMPKGITHKQFVHHGVGMLVFSIALAIGVIFYFFRGHLNFGEKNKLPKYLVYAWIVQNLMMVISTAVRNNMYITDALLTYKRIGVYYWLFMAACGLAYTYIKIAKVKSAWYMIRANSLLACVVLVLSCSVDWDTLISDYNISRTHLLASLDKRYLISLSEATIPQLYQLRNREGFNTDSAYHYEFGSHFSSNKASLDHKLYRFLEKVQTGNWKSFNFRTEKVFRDICRLDDAGKIDTLNVSERMHSLKPLFLLANVKVINASYCWLSDYAELGHFKKLETVYISHVRADDLKELSTLSNLKQIHTIYTERAVVEELKRLLPRASVFPTYTHGYY
ncbi:MAG: DUF4153 domain-containing protein [Bacteroidia bacterium]